MIKSRLIEVVRTFSKKEFREMKKWINSPFHNQREDVILLFEYLLIENNLFNDVELSKERVFQYVYPREKFDDAKIRQTIHFLFKSLEDFLVYTENEKDELKSKILLAKIYRKRKIEKNFHKVRKNIEVAIQQEALDEEGIYNAYLFQNELYEYLISTNRTQTLNLKALIESFDKALITEKLKQACILISHQAVFKAEYSDEVIKFIDSYISNNSHLLDTQILALYYFAYKTLSEEDGEKYFKNFKNLLLESNKVFVKEKMRDLYTIAINFCIKKFNSGAKIFINEAWDLYKQGIGSEILLIDGELNHYTYRNFISSGLVLKNYEEVETYIYKYGVYLNKEYKDHYINFNLVRLFFEKGSYEKAMELVGQYEFKDVLMNISAKTIQLKIYYELSEFRILESFLESMRAYVQRKKELGNQRKSNYKNIIRYTKKLLKVNPYSRAQKEKLKAEIEAAKPLTEKAWLLKQLAEL